MQRRVFIYALPLAALAGSADACTLPAARVASNTVDPSSKKGRTVNIVPWHPADDDVMRTDLCRRLAATRWPDAVLDNWQQGTAPQPLRDIVRVWATAYDWQAARTRLLSLPHFRAEIDGYGLHFLHFKGRGAVRQPLLLLNGWPSSFVEYGKLAPLLADPAANGAAGLAAFDLVIPAHPGFGYSDRPTAPDQLQVVELFHRLMSEGLGYGSYVVSGTDVGAGVATRMAMRYPDAVRGLHISAVVDPPLAADAAPLGEDELAYQARVRAWSDKEGAYLHLQATRPQTVAYALNDSPAGLASWIVEKFRLWSDAGEDLLQVFPADMLIDNLNLYWSTQTIASSMRYYYEARHFRAPLQLGDHVSVPTAVCMWPKDLVVAPRAYAERFYNVRQYTLQPRGGHFPAWEQPALYAADVRKFVQMLKDES